MPQGGWRRNAGSGGHRKGAGRPAGSVNHAAQERALMAQVVVGRNPRKAMSLDVLRRRLQEFDNLATAARIGNDVTYSKWAKLSVEVAKELINFEVPRLSATATLHATPLPAGHATKFPLRVFDSQRKPVDLNLELTAISDAPAASAAVGAGAPDAAPAAAQPASENVNAGSDAPETNGAEVLSQPEAPPSRRAWRAGVGWIDTPEDVVVDETAAAAPADPAWVRMQAWRALTIGNGPRGGWHGR
jgi:hypothetical protein